MRTINAKQLHEMMLKHPGMPVVDVLAKDTHRKAHIPGSINVPLEGDGFLDRLRRISADPNQPVVVYCKNKDCDASPRAAARLEDAGYAEVIDFEGGMTEWENAGYSLVAT